MATSTKLKESYKAGAAFITSLTALESFAVALDASSTHPWIHAAAVALSGVVGGATWFVRNKATFDQIVKALDEDPVLEEKVTTVVVEKAIEASPDLVEDLIRQYRDQ